MRQLVALVGALVFVAGSLLIWSVHRPVAEKKAGVGQLALHSASLALPADIGTLPDRPGRELVEVNCTGCHSAEMLTTQPPLKPAQWSAAIRKMRQAYHAPVAAGADAAIIAYLSGLDAAQPSRPASTPR